MRRFIIITTINPPTKTIEKFLEYGDWEITVAGDLKTPPFESSDQLVFLSTGQQARLGFAVAEKLPFNHYTRKNIGYLYAISKGAEVLYDTDDDNMPHDNWGLPDFAGAFNTVAGCRFCNIYEFFTERKVWPRGYPLRLVNEKNAGRQSVQQQSIGVWQGLADLDPDVDALYRLLFGEEIQFRDNESIVLDRGVYCPFNSQNTFWNKAVFPYLYLPATVSFRFTDILRGYIAQRCFWEHGLKLGFTKATVYQERNSHDLMRDFESEVPCYLQVDETVRLLDGLSLSADHESNLIRIYDALIQKGIVDTSEMAIVTSWLNDLDRVL